MHKTFKGVTGRSKCSIGWFYGFKLYIIVNERGELLSFKVTKGITNDRVPVKKLWEGGIQLITNVKKNMKNKLIPLEDKLHLRKRFIIETKNDQLKNIQNIEHSRHRSPTNLL